MIQANKMFEYVIRHFSSVYHLPGEVRITYGNSGQKGIRIRQYKGPFFNAANALPDEVIWLDWKDRSIPFLFGTGNGNLISHTAKGLLVEQDIIAGSFYFLSGWQEFHAPERDLHGRFPYEKSIQKKLEIAALPVVNYYFDMLKEAIEAAYNLELKPRLWGNRPFSVCLTHDVDHCRSAWKIAGVEAAKKGDVWTPWKLLYKKLSGHDAWFNFGTIMQMEKRFDAHSTFFFIPVKGKWKGLPNADYDIRSSRMLLLFEEMKKNGFEVALHGSFGTHADAGQLEREKRSFPFEVYGNRFHFLKYDPHCTPDVIERAALLYDTTLGFAEQAGFRNGYCFPFMPFNFQRKRAAEYLEIPMHVMDTSYWLDKYMGLNLRDIPDSLRRLSDEVARFGGCFTILWHNNTFSRYKFAGWASVYMRFLQHCAEKNAALLSAGEVYKQMSVLHQK